MDEEPTEAAETQPADPTAVIQEAIASTVDDQSLLAGFVVIAEWIEADGTFAMSVIHSPMPPWHFDGLVRFGLEANPGQMYPVLLDAADMDDEDWDDED